MDLSANLGNGSIGLGRYLLLLLILSAALVVVSAQDVGMESGENTSTEDVLPLDRRTKMLLPLTRKDYLSNQAALALGETGLGIFDAFFASLSMIIVSEVLSTGLGRIVPNLISRKHTNSAATILYAFFGLRLLYIAWRSDSKASQKKEMEEVEEKLESGQGKTTLRRFFSRFCTPIFLEF